MVFSNLSAMVYICFTQQVISATTVSRMFFGNRPTCNRHRVTAHHHQVPTMLPRDVLEGGKGVCDPKVCVPKMARPDFPNGKFRVFRRWSLWSGGRGLPPPLLLRCTAILTLP